VEFGLLGLRKRSPGGPERERKNEKTRRKKRKEKIRIDNDI